MGWNDHLSTYIHLLPKGCRCCLESPDPVCGNFKVLVLRTFCSSPVVMKHLKAETRIGGDSDGDPLCQDETVLCGKMIRLGTYMLIKEDVSFLVDDFLDICWDSSFEIVLDRRWDAKWNTTEFLNVQYSFCFLKSGFDCTWKDELLFKQGFSALLEGFEAFSFEQWSKAWLFSLNQGVLLSIYV